MAKARKIRASQVPQGGENLGSLWATESLSGMVILLSIYERYGID